MVRQYQETANSLGRKREGSFRDQYSLRDQYSVFPLPSSLHAQELLLSVQYAVLTLDKLVTSVKKKKLTHPKPQKIPGAKLPLLVILGGARKGIFMLILPAFPVKIDRFCLPQDLALQPVSQMLHWNFVKCMVFNMYYTLAQRNNNIMVISQVSKDGAVKTEQVIQ